MVEDRAGGGLEQHALLPAAFGTGGAVGSLVGLRATSPVAGTVPLVIAVVALVVGRLPADEVAHPPDGRPADGERGEDRPRRVPALEPR